MASVSEKVGHGAEAVVAIVGALLCLWLEIFLLAAAYSNVVDFNDWFVAAFCVGLAVVPVAACIWAGRFLRRRGATGFALARSVGLIAMLSGLVLATVAVLLTAPF